MKGRLVDGKPQHAEQILDPKRVMRLFFRASRKNPPHHERHAGEEREKGSDPPPPILAGLSDGEKSLPLPKATMERQFTGPADTRKGTRHSRQWPARAAQGDFAKGSRSPGADRPKLREAWIREAAKGSACRAGQNELNGVRGRSPGGGDWKGVRRRTPSPPGGDHRKQRPNSLSAKRKHPPRQRPGASSSPSSLPEGTTKNNASNSLSAKRKTPPRQRPGACLCSSKIPASRSTTLYERPGRCHTRRYK